jgi:hypothetical protein
MNLGLYRSWHGWVALALAGVFAAWHWFAGIPFGSRADDNIWFLLTTGWVAVACYAVLALYAARRAAHRLRLSPEFAWKAQLPALERAQSELTALQQRVLRRETVGRATAIGLFRVQVGPREPLGRLAAWLHAHFFYGFLAAVLVWFHGGGRCGTTMGFLLNALSYFVIASGLLGAFFWTFGPTWLTRAERELTVEKALALREYFARKIQEAQTAPMTRAKDAADAAAAARVAADDAARAAENPTLAGKDAEAAKKLAKKTADDAKKAQTKAEAAQAAIASETVRLEPEIATLQGQARRADAEAVRLSRYRTLLRGWRLFHVPASIVLLALVGIHVLSIWYY